MRDELAHHFLQCNIKKKRKNTLQECYECWHCIVCPLDGALLCFFLHHMCLECYNNKKKLIWVESGRASKSICLKKWVIYWNITLLYHQIYALIIPFWSHTNQNAKWVIILNDFEWYCVCPGDFQDMSGQQLGKGLVIQKDK